MFLIPGAPKNDPLAQLAYPDAKRSWAQHNFSMLHPEDGADHLRSLNVPFCINIMTGGRYREGQLVSITSLSGKEQFHLEKSNPSPGSSSLCEERIEMHQHDYFELMYVFEGEVEQHIENGCFRYTKGVASLLNLNTRHFEVLGESYFLVFLCFSKEFIRNFITTDLPHGNNEQNAVYRFFTSNLGDSAQYKKDYLKFTPVPSNRKDAEQVSRILEDLTQELLLKQPGHTHVEMGLASRILAYLQNPDYYECTHVTLDSSAEAYLFSKITRYMESQEGRVTRADLAEHLCYSSDYINRIVKKHSGMSISEYNQLICLKKAEQMLIETNSSIGSIIASLGFKNKTYFYKLFDRKHGITPLEYRKRFKSEDVGA